MIRLFSQLRSPRPEARASLRCNLDDDLQTGNSESMDVDEEYQLWEAIKRESEHGDTQMLIAVRLKLHS